MTSFVTIKKWSPVFVWGYNTQSDTCSICKNNLTEKSPNSLTDNSFMNKKSVIIKGKCGHVYHNDCIESWRKQGSNSCPECSTPWITHINDLDSSKS